MRPMPNFTQRPPPPHRASAFLPRDAMHVLSVMLCGWVSVCHIRVLCRNGSRYGHSSMTFEQETVPKLSNGTIFNYVERPLTQNSRSSWCGHTVEYPTLSISETVKDKKYRGILIRTYTHYTEGYRLERSFYLLIDLVWPHQSC